jgi:hypothetical protein
MVKAIAVTLRFRKRILNYDGLAVRDSSNRRSLTHRRTPVTRPVVGKVAR